MWFAENNNDLWNNQITGDKFTFIFKMDEHCEAVVKTPIPTKLSYKVQFSDLSSAPYKWTLWEEINFKVDMVFINIKMQLIYQV